MATSSNVASADVAGTKVGRVRFTIVAMLFVITVINYADRATMSVAKPGISQEFGLNAAQMGWILSAFGWSYVACQIPGGWLLDRFGSKMVYFASIFFWSLFTLLQGGVAIVGAAAAFSTLFFLRLLVGLAESPSFPANARIVAAWFPANERGTASAIFNSAQYFATVLFGPIMGWIALNFGWHAVFYFMGGLGILISLVWLKVIYSPKDHPRLSPEELDYIERGGALVNMDQPKPEKYITRAELELDYVERGGLKTMNDRAEDKKNPVQWGYIRQLLTNRMMLGIYLGQFCINCLTVFFATWFIPYLVEQRGTVDPERGLHRLDPGHLRLRRRRAGRRHLGCDAAERLFDHGGPQDPDRARHAAVDDPGDLQLRGRLLARHPRHCVILLRQGHRGARMDRDLGYLAEGDRGLERRPVQHLRQSLDDHDADHHRLHHPGHRVL